ncbi:hypothetical protein ACGC1H_005313 [Rhizoctonia solani]
MDYMTCRINTIYRNVYNLIAVCATWRRVGLAYPALWKLVPIIEHQNPAFLRAPPLEHILQRAGNHHLHLAIMADKFPYEQFKHLCSQWNRFSVINIWSDAVVPTETAAVLCEILKHSPPGSISKLSLKKQPNNWVTYSSFNKVNFNPQISQLVGSLSVFRISAFTLEWKNIRFSHRLIELRVDSIMLRSDSKIRTFFAALSSAPELKELSLLSIQLDSDQLDKDVPLEVLSLPKLQLLHLGCCCLNALELILSHIAHSSYDLTINLHPDNAQHYPPCKEVLDPGLVCAFLSGVAIDKLILRGGHASPWAHTADLRRVLESAPGLKILTLNGFLVDPDLLMGLAPFPASASPTDQAVFPKLTRLEMHNAQFLVPLSVLKPAFEVIFNSHRIETMVLGGISSELPQVSPDESDEVVRWIRCQIPQFSLSCEPTEAPELIDIWRLWDI